MIAFDGIYIIFIHKILNLYLKLRFYVGWSG